MTVLEPVWSGAKPYRPAERTLKTLRAGPAQGLARITDTAGRLRRFAMYGRLSYH